MAGLAALRAPFDMPSQKRVVELRLSGDYDSVVGAATVRHCVREAELGIGTPRVLRFVPILMERDARCRILALIASRSAQGTQAAPG
jgi:hypothetical protein